MSRKSRREKGTEVASGGMTTTATEEVVTTDRREDLGPTATGETKIEMQVIRGEITGRILGGMEATDQEIKRGDESN